MPTLSERAGPTANGATVRSRCAVPHPLFFFPVQDSTWTVVTVFCFAHAPRESRSRHIDRRTSGSVHCDTVQVGNPKVCSNLLYIKLRPLAFDSDHRSCAFVESPTPRRGLPTLASTWPLPYECMSFWFLGAARVPARGPRDLRSDMHDTLYCVKALQARADCRTRPRNGLPFSLTLATTKSAWSRRGENERACSQTWDDGRLRTL